MFKHILVPTDGSRLSQEAGRQAVSFARATGARITAFHARPKEVFLDYDVTDSTGKYASDNVTSLERFEELADSRAEEALDFVGQLCAAADVPCMKISLTSDYPYDTIITAAQENDCDLIFMASHGRKGLSGLLLGSETQKVLTHSSIPVLVYRQS